MKRGRCITLNVLIIDFVSTKANTVMENKMGNANSMFAAKTADLAGSQTQETKQEGVGRKQVIANTEECNLRVMDTLSQLDSIGRLSIIGLSWR